jgi:hypothetical protein
MPRVSLGKIGVSAERLAGALAVLCLAVAALLVGRPSFSNASLPVRGVDDPVIAIQVARSLTDVDWVLGNAPSPDREVMRIKERIGFVFMGAYTALFLTLALLLMRSGGIGRLVGPAAMICALATAGFNVAGNLAVIRILDVPLYATTTSMIAAIRSASFATWALAALTLALLSTYFLRSPRFTMKCVGVLFLITAAMQLYGLRDNRFLVWEGGPAALAMVGVAVALLLPRRRTAAHLSLLVLIGGGSLHAEVNQVRSYHTHEPSDRHVLFAMATTPDQDVLSFVAKKSGQWRLTRVRNWLDKNPVEQTIDIPGIVVPEKSKDAQRFLELLSLEVLASPGGRFAVCVATGYWANNGQQGGSEDSVVSVVDLRAFQVLMTIHQSGSLDYFTDAAGRLVSAEIVDRDPSRLPLIPKQAGRWADTRLAFFTLPELMPLGSCQFRETLEGADFVPHDKDCGPSLEDLLAALSPKRDHSLGLRYPDRNVPPTGSTCRLGAASSDYRFRMENCGEYGRNVWTGSGTYRNPHVNILYTNGESVAGVIGETTRDSVHEAFAEHNGRDYLLVLEGGTNLKIYEIQDSHP